MKPLIVTARLAQGLVAADRWSPTLDGILAWAHMRRILPPEEFVGGAALEHGTAVEGLPLERCEHEGEWWYAASSPETQTAARQRRYYHRRFDEQHALTYTRSQAKVLTSAGPFKGMRHNEILTITPAIRWRAIGDQDAVRDLLTEVLQVGRGVGRGYGRVTEWNVAEGSEDDSRRARTERPLPVAFAQANGIDGPCLTWGVRPPPWLPGNSTLCVMPS